MVSSRFIKRNWWDLGAWSRRNVFMKDGLGDYHDEIKI